jgi:hypothetical protein
MDYQKMEEVAVAAQASQVSQEAWAYGRIEEKAGIR